METDLGPEVLRQVDQLRHDEVCARKKGVERPLTIARVENLSRAGRLFLDRLICGIEGI